VLRYTYLKVATDESKLVHEVIDLEDDSEEEENESAEEEKDVDHAKPFLVLPSLRGVHAQRCLCRLRPGVDFNNILTETFSNKSGLHSFSLFTVWL